MLNLLELLILSLQFILMKAHPLKKFFPTLGHPPTTYKEAGQSECSPSVRFSIQVDPLVDDQHSVPDSDFIGESIENLGGNFADPANQNPVNVNAHVEPTDTCAPKNVKLEVNVESQPET
ncbi:uncharacterized protein E5676_scaffold609G001330 [Cucumis melo var. makuwa]|uniref:Envelope-like protein n=1 Tax=Cucumis melo var. makuwa TaxID=1194695 RepID=A0A5D3DCS1_CUCMM|nr:uncharacterized protein E6C27_scaffold60G001840 [Cucumis melo var. makuwa]TYK21457.1 uncharacterized protein E5676_scaffold609G001330 [Cucumis melo var. makuwa]